MTITVTQEHIQLGIALSWTDCPVALAIDTANPGRNPVVSRTDVLMSDLNYERVTGCSLRKYHDLPSVATKWIDAFDEGTIGAPFSFTLD